MVGEQVIQPYIKFSFLKKTSFYFKVNKALKDCKEIESYLIKNDSLKKIDSKLNLIISDGFSNEINSSYFLVKLYNKQGSISPINKYSFIDGEIEKYFDKINLDILIVDLYDNSIYLHNFSKTSLYITGYLIKQEIQSETNKTLIFSNEKVKIEIKKTNDSQTINVVDDFINKYIM